MDVRGGNGARGGRAGDSSLGRVYGDEDGLRGLNSAGSLDMAEREGAQLAHHKLFVQVEAWEDQARKETQVCG